jgi:thioredoxin reductase
MFTFGRSIPCDTGTQQCRFLNAHLLETNRLGVFAVGDVRGGNQKRVASAVGEGSTAIALVHQVLKE